MTTISIEPLPPLLYKVKLPSVGFSSSPTEIEELRLKTPCPVATPE